MALGDLVTVPYMFEFNSFAWGGTTDYDIYNVGNLLSTYIRSDSSDRFGRHGGSAARMYASMKTSTFDIRIRATTDTDFETKRLALGTAFAPIVDPKDSLWMVFMLPGAGTNKVVMKSRPLSVDPQVDRDFALKYPKFVVRMEHVDPLIYGLTENSQSFTMPSDTRTINNAGNGKTNWRLSVVGPITNPVITNNTTGQTITFDGLILNGTQVLTLDSSDSTAVVNGESVYIYIASGFSWWSLPPGNTSITVSGTTATTAAATLFWRNGYWLP